MPDALYDSMRRIVHSALGVRMAFVVDPVPANLDALDGMGRCCGTSRLSWERPLCGPLGERSQRPTMVHMLATQVAPLRPFQNAPWALTSPSSLTQMAPLSTIWLVFHARPWHPALPGYRVRLCTWIPEW